MPEAKSSSQGLREPVSVASNSLVSMPEVVLPEAALDSQWLREPVAVVHSQPSFISADRETPPPNYKRSKESPQVLSASKPKPQKRCKVLEIPVAGFVGV